MREKSVASHALLAIQRLGARLFRNNVGAYKDDRDQWIHYGLGVGSSDYIGWTERVITAQDVGRKVAIFTAMETKRSKGGVRTPEQINFVERVRQAGGMAGFANDDGSARAIVEEWGK